MKHFALNVAVAGVVWAWGYATGQLMARVLPAIELERRACRG